jgi:hypothetical protein
MGILPLDQPGGNGQIDFPVMICPVREDEFRASGMRWLGAFKVSEVSDEQVDELSGQITAAWFPAATDDKHHHAVSHDLIDPFGGPDEADPDLTPPLEEDGAEPLD